MIEIRYIFDWQQKQVNEYTIKNGKYQFSAINIGAAITKLIVPNKHEKLENIILRYYDYKEYKNNNFLLGSLIDYQKYIMMEESQLNYYFECKIELNTLVFTHKNVDKYIQVKYTLINNQLIIEYETNDDLLLSNLLCFNLTGNHKGDIKNHKIFIGNEEIAISSPIDNYKLYKVPSDFDLITISLKENGIKINLNASEICISNGKTFKKLFYINKETLADLYSCIGVTFSGNKTKRYEFQIN